MRKLILLLTILLGCSPMDEINTVDKTADICIYSATPAGIAAAISGARAGKSVLLIEPTSRIGGMVTNGLSHTDFHSYEALSGFFLDFSQKVHRYYIEKYGQDSEQVKTSFKGTFGEPKVNLLIMKEMLAEYPEITVIKGYHIDDVTVSDSSISRSVFVSSDNSVTVAASVFIDASYEGDLMALSGVTYHVGREGQDKYDESLAPEEPDNQLQGYNFRFCATNVPENRAEVHPPEGYNREDFLDLLPILESGDIEQIFDYPRNCIFKAQTPPLPNGKYDINDVSRGAVRLSMPGYNREWPEGSAETRQQIFDRHLYHSVGILYFLQNDKEVPQKYQDQANEWGWCKDEFIENDHLPIQLYVREARRMQGEHIYIQQDSEHAPGDARAKLHTDAIAMGDYGNNCHGTAHEGPIIGGEHTGEFYHQTPPYQIPYGVILPKEVDNLLVPVAVSSSHVGFCAIRLEPIWSSLGQAAGVAASLACEQNISVQKVDVKEIQHKLHESGSATVYVSDVLPGHELYQAVQWWGTLGGFHGLYPYDPEKVRGENLHGQYYKGAPNHQAALDSSISPQLRKQWDNILNTQGIQSDNIFAANRRDFIIQAYELSRK